VKWEHAWGYVTYCYILTSSIHAMAVATNFKFGAQIDNKNYCFSSVKLLWA